MKKINQRVAWIDECKGIGIILVVVGHAWRGLNNAEILKNESTFEVVDTLIYSFHMPLFFVLSGLLYARSVRSSVSDFMKSRVIRLLWPLVLWTWIFFAFKAVAGNLANNAIGWSDFPIVPLPPREHLWFLWALFVIQVACFPFIRIGDRIGRLQSLIGFAFLVSLCLFFAPIDFEDSAVWWVSTIRNAPFFLMGAVIAPFLGKIEFPYSGLISFVGFVAVVSLSLIFFDHDWQRLAIGAAASLFLIMAIIHIDQQIIPRSLMEIVRMLGIASMAIYVSHTIFSAATRVVLLKLDVGDVLIHMFLGTIAGLAMPLLLLGIARRTRTTTLAGL